MPQLTWQQTAQLAKAAAAAMAPRYRLDQRNTRMLARLLIALAEHESRRRTDARNPNSTAAGILQILTGTRTWLEQRLKWRTTNQQTLIDSPYYSFLLAAEYLLWLYANKAKKGWDRTIIAYNQGHYNTSPEALNYLAKVQRAYQSAPMSSLA